ncbi:MAG: CYTH domain-containing protein [Cryomorphaceae bacterium]|jgi:adenylate cyclase|nr:CYTH domain-containing protein [Cryomorphaceae bacterium]
MQEIERKFTVDHEKWALIPKPLPQRIVQGYLVREPEKTIRIRTKGSKGYLTIKGKTTGISREEFEYEIPFSEAEQLLTHFAEKVLIKDRFEIKLEQHLWDVDVFHGKLEGLIIAELELQREDETFSIPEWIKEDVSDNPNYYNSNLIDKL